VLDGDPSRPLNFRPTFIIVIVISLQHGTGVIGLFKFKFKFQYSMHSIFRKFNRTQSVPLCVNNSKPQSFVIVLGGFVESRRRLSSPKRRLSALSWRQSPLFCSHGAAEVGR